MGVKRIIRSGRITYYELKNSKIEVIRCGKRKRYYCHFGDNRVKMSNMVMALQRCHKWERNEDKKHENN